MAAIRKSGRVVCSAVLDTLDVSYNFGCIHGSMGDESCEDDDRIRFLEASQKVSVSERKSFALSQWPQQTGRERLCV